MNPSKGALEQLVTNLRSIQRSLGSNPAKTYEQKKKKREHESLGWMTPLDYVCQLNNTSHWIATEKQNGENQNNTTCVQTLLQLH